MTFKEKISQLCEGYDPEQITTKNVHGRNESWVEQHHIFDRINALGIPYTWEISRCEATEVVFGGSGKPAQHAFVQGRLTLKFEDGDLFYDGVGEATMVGFTDARKGAASKAFRHAVKPFTTFLWGGGLPHSEPEEVQRSSAQAPTSTPSPPPKGAQYQAPSKQVPSPHADAPHWAAKLPGEWNMLLGRVAEACHLERSEFEGVLLNAASLWKGNNGTIRDAQTQHGSFEGLFNATAADGRPLHGAALNATKKVQEWAYHLEAGHELALTYHAGNNQEATYTIASRHGDPADPRVATPTSTKDVLDDVPF